MERTEVAELEDMPRPADAEEKTWGWAQPISSQPYIRADGSEAVLCRCVRVFIRKGGYSSVHFHRDSTNIFSVTSGKLILRQLKRQPPFEILAEWTQEANDHPIFFQPGRVHQFEALTNVLALEVYIAANNGDASQADIERFTKNGVKPST